MRTRTHLSAVLFTLVAVTPALVWAQDGGPPPAAPDSPFNFRLTPPSGLQLPPEDSDVRPGDIFDPLDHSDAGPTPLAPAAPDAGPPPDKSPEPLDAGPPMLPGDFRPADGDPAGDSKPPAEDGPAPGTDSPPLPGQASIGFNAPSLDPTRCISPQELERATLGGKREAFGSSAIPLGPFFWATRDRTLVQAMLVYWRYIDVDTRSRLEFLFPFYLKTCEPTSETFVGTFALWGSRTDNAGTAGYIGPYLYRRDLNETSDVIFPVFWSLKGEKESTFIAGPWYDFERRGKRRYGLVPFFFGGREPSGAFFDITPVFAKWGDSVEQNFWTLQTWGTFSHREWSVASLPFYFGGESDDGQYHHLIPPLLSFFWGEDTPQGPVSRVVIGAFGDFSYPDGRDTGIFPLALWGEGAAGPGSTFGRSLWEEVDSFLPFNFGPRPHASFQYQLAPFFVHLEDTIERESGPDTRDRWVVGPAYLSASPSGWDAGVFPLWFEGWETARLRTLGEKTREKARDGEGGAPELTPFHYRVIPPLLYGHFAEGQRRRTIFAQTYFFADDADDSYAFGSIPFYFRGRHPKDHDTWYDHVPLALNFHWGDDKGTQHIIGPGFSFADARGFDHGIFPFYFAGETAPGHNRDGALSRFEDFVFDNWRPEDVIDEDALARGIPTDHYRVVPPLLYAHFGDDDGETTVFAQSYLVRQDLRWDFGSIPFAFFGRDDEDESFYDVIPPLLFARWGDETNTQLIAGPWYDFRLSSLFGEEDLRSNHFGVFPFFFAGRFGPGVFSDGPLAKRIDDRVVDGESPDVLFRYHLGPFYLHFGVPEFDVLWAAQTVAWWDDEGWDAWSVPFYFGGGRSPRERPQGGRTAETWFHLVPPLFTFIGGSDGERLANGELDPLADEGAWSSWFTGPLWILETERGIDASLFPLFAFGSVDGGAEGFAPPEQNQDGTWRPHRDRPFFSQFAGEVLYNLFDADTQEHVLGPRNRGFSYHLIPPLLYGHLSTSTHERTWFAQSYLFRSDAKSASSRSTGAGYDLGSIPFFFHGRTFPDAGEAGGATTRKVGGEVGGSYYDIIPPLAFGAWGNDDETRLFLLQTYYASEHIEASVAADGSAIDALDAWRLWSIPFFFLGETVAGAQDPDAEGGSDAGKDSHFYAIIPPLGFAHFGDDDSSNTLVGPFFSLENATGYDTGFAPLYLAGTADGGPTPITKFTREFMLTPIIGKDAAQSLLPDTGHHYRTVPPLGYLHIGADDDELTLLGPNFLRRSNTGWDAGVFPLGIAGATSTNSDDDFSYAIAPLLLTGHVQAGNNRFTLAGPWFDIHTDVGDENEFRALGLLPVFGGTWSRDGYLFAGPGFGWWGDDVSDFWWALQTLGADEAITLEDLSRPMESLRDQVADGSVELRRARLYSVPFAFFEEVRADTLDLAVAGSESVPGSRKADAPPRVASSTVLESKLFIPLLLTWREENPNATHLVAGPWFDFDDEHGRDLGLFPFYFEGSSEGTGRSPLWRWASTFGADLFGGDDPDDPDDASGGVGARRTGARGLGVRAGPSHYRVLPIALYLHFGDDEMHRTIFGPSWWFDDADGWRAGILPVYFGRRSVKEGDFDVVPPLLFVRWRDAAAESGGLWLGPVFNWDAPHYDDTMVLGAFYGGSMQPGEDGSLVEGPMTAALRSVPFGSLVAGEHGEGGAWWMVPPAAAHRSSSKGSRTFVLQSWWIEEEGESHLGSAPFFFHGRSTGASGNSWYDIVPPVLFGMWGDDDETSLFALQTWAQWSHADSETDSWRLWSAPFYFGGSRTLGPANQDGVAPRAYHHLVPLAGTFFWGDEVAGEERAIIAPFLTLWLDNPTDAFFLVGPFTRYEDKQTGDYDQALWPVWFSGREGDSFYDVVPPIYGAWGDAASSTRFLLTAFETTSANGDYTRAILPFYYSQKRFRGGEVASSFDMITPAYFAWSEGNTARSFFAPTLTYASTVGDEDFLIAPFVYHLENEAESDTVVFPFFWHFRRAEGGDVVSEATVVSGVWWDFSWPTEGKRLQIAPGYMRFDAPDEELHIAGPVSWTKGKGEEAQAWSFHVFPFFSMWSYHPGHFKWRALLFAAGYEREEAPGETAKEQWMLFGIKTDAE